MENRINYIAVVYVKQFILHTQSHKQSHSQTNSYIIYSQAHTHTEVKIRQKKSA